MQQPHSHHQQAGYGPSHGPPMHGPPHGFASEPSQPYQDHPHNASQDYRVGAPLTQQRTQPYGNSNQGAYNTPPWQDTNAPPWQTTNAPPWQKTNAPPWQTTNTLPWQETNNRPLWQATPPADVQPTQGRQYPNPAYPNVSQNATRPPNWQQAASVPQYPPPEAQATSQYPPNQSLGPSQFPPHQDPQVPQYATNQAPVTHQYAPTPVATVSQTQFQPTQTTPSESVLASSQSVAPTSQTPNAASVPQDQEEVHAIDPPDGTHRKQSCVATHETTISEGKDESVEGADREKIKTGISRYNRRNDRRRKEDPLLKREREEREIQNKSARKLQILNPF